MTPACVSVVVPAYNAEAHLKECLDSILSQDEVGEVIVVDDGSTDDTLLLARKFADSDCRVTVLHQNNSGVSAARNAGMGAASMPWLAFVDADDTIPVNAFASQINTAKCFEADMTYGDFAMLRNGDVFPWNDEFQGCSTGLVPVHSVLTSLISTNQNSVSGSCYRILFKSSFLIGMRLRFPEGISMSEDFCFILDCLVSNPIVAYVNEAVYFVRREGESATQRYMSDLERSMDFVNGKLAEVCVSCEAPMASYWECVSNTAWAAARTLYKDGTPYDARERHSEIRRIMKKYHDAIRHISVFGELGCLKAGVLKVGAVFPSLLWIVFEASSRMSQHGNS